MRKRLARFAVLLALLGALHLLGGCAAAPAESIGESGSLPETENAAPQPQEIPREPDSVPEVESSSAELTREEKIAKNLKQEPDLPSQGTRLSGLAAPPIRAKMRIRLRICTAAKKHCLRKALTCGIFMGTARASAALKALLYW